MTPRGGVQRLYRIQRDGRDMPAITLRNGAEKCGKVEAHVPGQIRAGNLYVAMSWTAVNG